MKLKHITFMVRDLEKSVTFYETMAGLQIIRLFSADGAKLAFMANEEGDTEVEFVEFPEGQKYEGKGMFLCFETKDSELEALQRKAKELALNPSDIRNPGDQSRYFYVYDPDGVSVQFRSFDHQ